MTEKATMIRLEKQHLVDGLLMDDAEYAAFLKREAKAVAEAQFELPGNGTSR